MVKNHGRGHQPGLLFKLMLNHGPFFHPGVVIDFNVIKNVSVNGI